MSITAASSDLYGRRNQEEDHRNITPLRDENFKVASDSACDPHPRNTGAKPANSKMSLPRGCGLANISIINQLHSSILQHVCLSLFLKSHNLDWHGKANILVLTRETKENTSEIPGWSCALKSLQRVYSWGPWRVRSATWGQPHQTLDLLTMWCQSEGGDMQHVLLLRNLSHSHSGSPRCFTWGFFPHGAAEQPTTPFTNKAHLSAPQPCDKRDKQCLKWEPEDDLWMRWNFLRHKRVSSHENGALKTH